MEIVKLQDYKENYICYIDDFGDLQTVGTDDIETIKELVAEDIILYGVIKEKVFDKSFVEFELRELFERRAEDCGYEDMEEQLDFSSEEYQKVKQAVIEYIESLGTVNDTYYKNPSIIIEVEGDIR